MPTTTASRTSASLLLIFLLGLAIPPARAETPTDDWVARSDEIAKLYLEIVAPFFPEGAGQAGIDGLDEDITQLPLDLVEQESAATRKALALLAERRESETHPAVLQDLDIMTGSGERDLLEARLESELMLPYFNLHEAVFQGIRGLLDDQVPAERRPAALVRLERYAGLDEGYTPLAEQAEAFIRARFDDDLLGPFRSEVEKDLANAPRYLEGIAGLFQKYDIEGYETALEMLRTQLAAYETFLREEVLPRCRSDFRLPPELYAMNLVNRGVDMPVEELSSRAKVAFREIQNEMQVIAALVATKRGYDSADYRDVIRELKREQLVGEAILPHYRQRIAELEKLIEEGGVVTLPDREMLIRLATEAESASTPAPSMRPPRLIGNTGEMGEFVLPLTIPGEDGEAAVSFDDFTFDAAAWTLSVHEGRPGHEMQFASIVEKGVSQARILFAFNSVNVEGWALYMEAEMKPYMPLEGQLISLQHRLLRAARAFLDPGLQFGEISSEEAMRILTQEIVVSEVMAAQEVERYTSRAPGQATSYFCGYTRWMELRTDVEIIMGEDFDRRAFHDFVLSQGLLPAALLRQAVMEQFVGGEPEVDG